MINNSNKKRIVILLNITNNCNMACSYCYYQHEMDSHPGNMPIDTLEAIIKGLAESPFEEIEFIFHGGEPLIRQETFYEQSISLQETYLHNKTCFNYIQTNGTLLTDELLDMIVKHGFEVGISFDGPEHIHDHYRKFKNGKGSYKCIVENIHKLQQKKVDIGILSVCSDKTLEDIDGYYELFKGLTHIKGIDIIAPELNETSIILQQGNYARLVIALFDKWFYDTLCDFNIRTLDTIIKGFVFSTPFICYFMKNCIVQNPMLSISPKGYASPCDNNTDINLGSIFEHSLEYMLFENPVRKRYGRKESDRVEKCIFCEWYDDCHGGCPTLSNEKKGYLYCEDMKKIFSHISHVLQDMHLYKSKVLVRKNIDLIPNKVLRTSIIKVYENLNLDNVIG
ncbi:radical SAM protein [Vallitalea pronyensis]|uniref:Radical SAM protein n=1 Tax=Vallitalea pronyensis TaxID=1348613 RepID=A0A8J8SH56_9FIRM|nr:radical SAM protein [Vallitalea pronyensis]QUI23084.1 radical SAM protein [Vallitalea pronyensis]